MALLQDISEKLQKGKAPEVKALVQQAMDEKYGARDILENGLMAGMNIVGVKFKANEIYVPEVLIAARAMNAGIELLRPLLVEQGVKARGKAVIGTVKGDLHDIGKNLVKMMLEGKGIEVIDLGTDVSADKFVAAAKEHGAQIVCCSALLTTTMTEMKNVVQKITDSGLRSTVKIMVGGAPVTDSFCKSIGADFYEPDAASAAERALAIVSAA
ncbi:MAG TPA: corrinoid protein [Spirochaetia bacterium]|nr:corrinoid protein [Spirochaetia bacterium]